MTWLAIAISAALGAALWASMDGSGPSSADHHLRLWEDERRMSDRISRWTGGYLSVIRRGGRWYVAATGEQLSDLIKRIRSSCDA